MIREFALAQWHDLLMSALDELDDLFAIQAAAKNASLDSWSRATQLSAAELDAFVTHPRNAEVVSTQPDGRPLAVPAGFVSVGIEMWLPTSAGAVRRRDVAVHGALSLVVTESDRDEHATLLVEGPAREVAIGDVAPGVVLAYTEKYGQAPDWAGCWLVLRPRRVLSHRGVA